MEDRRDKNDEVSKRVWKTVEANIRKIGVAEIKGRGGKGGDRKKARRKRKAKEAKERKNSRSEKGSENMRNME